ncbi:hypothetical protein CLV98_107102 [Dyadobacter jejuensis]|uniref:Basic secretory peptidase family protein n=1 Tax=Dyadobacter jejuensis TaxID=1082580 RepID=A0A316AI23_9BACT|nr:metalloprotease [Dyadobacter jejuensis]PWJ57395.1 hypothetical protein CLV98_107102 [Dyadobacter jejuensis]
MKSTKLPVSSDWLIVGFVFIYSMIPMSGYGQDAEGCFLSDELISLGSVSATSGNLEIDFVAGQEVQRLRSMFGVNPQFYFFREIESPNAFATSEVNDESFPDGTVLFGLRLHNREMPKSMGGTTIPMIMAHEFGHILSFKMDLSFDGKYQELWADYCAGAYMFYRQFWKSTDVSATLKTFFEIGDYAFNSPSHHGTPQERYDSVWRGFSDAKGFHYRGISITLPDLVTSGSSYIEGLR